MLAVEGAIITTDATGRIARSTVLGSSSARQSSRNTLRSTQWFSASRAAWAKADWPERRVSNSVNHKVDPIGWTGIGVT